MSLSARYGNSAPVLTGEGGGGGGECGGGGSGGDGQDDGVALAQPRPKPSTAPQPCSSCRKATATCRSRFDLFCRPCFLATCMARNKKLLTLPILTGSRVLLAYSGGASSRVALDVASLLMHCGRRRRWWREASVVHIDTSVLWDEGLLGGGVGGGGGGGGDRVGGGGGLSPALLTSALASGLNTYIVPLEAAFTPHLIIAPAPAPRIELGGEGVAPAPASGSQLDLSLPFSPFDPHSPAVAHRVQAIVATLKAARATPLLSLARQHLAAVFRATCGGVATGTTASGGSGVGRSGRGGGKKTTPPHPPPTDQCNTLLTTLISRLLHEVAGALGGGPGGIRLVTAATLDATAQGVFTATTGKRGASVPADVAPVDTRFYYQGQGHSAAVLWQRAPGSTPLAVTLVVPQGGVGEGSSSKVEGMDAAAVGEVNFTPFAPLESNWYGAVAQDGGVDPPPLPPSQQSGVGGGGGSVEASGSAAAATGTVVVRVAQEVEAREVALVCRFKGLEGCSKAAAGFLTPLGGGGGGIGGGGSVDAKCRDVLVGLQHTFPSTLHNVVKTAQKLALEGGGGLCGFCASVMPANPSSGGGGSGVGGERVKEKEEEGEGDVEGRAGASAGQPLIPSYPPKCCPTCAYLPPLLWEHLGGGAPPSQ